MLLDVPLLQPFIDSDGGVVLANTLHTLGAIGFLGGIVLYLSWYRGLTSGSSELMRLRNAAFATYLSLALNFLGGAMRMYQSGHPSLSAIGTSQWVQVLFVKHLFLIAAGVAAVVLFERVGPRLHRMAANDAARQSANRAQATLAGSVVVAIVLAGLLGAVTTVSDLGTGGPTLVGPDMDHAEREPLYYNSTNRLTTSLVTDRPAQTTFVVPAGYAVVTTTLTWDGPQTLRLQLLDPEGNPAGQAEEVAGRVRIAASFPAPGIWTASVSSDLAVDVPYTLATKVDPASDHTNILIDTVTLNPGVFYEINTEMELDAVLNWDWHITQGQPVHFDVHTHFDGEAQYLVDESVAEHEGNVTAHRKGGYSLLWQNEGATPLTLEYRVWGDFHLHSIVP